MALTPGTFGLLHPGWLWLLPALMGLALVWRRQGGRRSEDLFAPPSLAIRHPLLARLSLPADRRPAHDRLARALVWPALACLILALAQPVRVGQRLPEPPPNRDVVLLVDTGVAMVLRDYLLDGRRVSRLALLKSLLDRFVQKLAGQRVAVIVFGATAATYVPLTPDTRLVRRMLARLRPTLAGRFSAIGEAVALAVREAGDAPRRRRVLVLFSDVHQPTGRIAPSAAAALAAEARLPLYTVAIGATDYAAEEHRRSGLLYHPVNRSLLSALATRTGARSYLARDGQALAAAIADIDQRERQALKGPPRYRLEPLYPWPLLAGILLLALLPLAGRRRRPRQ